MTRIQNIDALRALAVMLVVVTHAGWEIVPGGSGVTIFFVISGYVITGLLIREQQVTREFRIKAYYARRALKILPPLVGIVLVPSLIFARALDLAPVAMLQQLVFSYNWFKMTRGSQGVLPGSAVVWSLSIEEQFYVAVALMWLLASRAKSSARLLGIAMLTVWVGSTLLRCYFAFLDLPHDSTGNVSRIYYGTDTRMSSIALGSLAALVTRTEWLPNVRGLLTSTCSRLPAFYVASGLFVASLLVRFPFFRDSFRFTVQEIVAAVWILGCLHQGAWPQWVARLSRSRVTQRIGLASYSLYLSHLIVIGLCDRLFGRQVPGLIFAPIAILLSVVMGIVFHRMFDEPFERFRVRFRLAKVSLNSPAN